MAKKKLKKRKKKKDTRRIVSARKYLYRKVFYDYGNSLEKVHPIMKHVNLGDDFDILSKLKLIKNVINLIHEIRYQQKTIIDLNLDPFEFGYDLAFDGDKVMFDNEIHACNAFIEEKKLKVMSMLAHLGKIKLARMIFDGL